VPEASREFEGALETETRTGEAIERPVGALTVPGLTVLWHPDLERTGERALLLGPGSGRAEPLSRAVPAFAAPGGGRPRPLADPYLSRRPFQLRPGGAPGTILVARGEAPGTLLLDGAPLEGERELSAAEIERGVVLLLGGRVVLLLSPLDPVGAPRSPELGMVGESAAMSSLRRELLRLAPLPVPVLLCGATGTGKELAARALHDAGARSRGPFVAVNMAAVPPALAAAELFGAERGAYTGAERRRLGTFQRADGGTLFLDEIGETPLEVQALLLRALETGEVQPVGADLPLRVDVRLVAATDADLPAAVAGGRFRAPLLHRLAGCEVRLPPLAARRDDFGRLFLHFARLELRALGEESRLATPAEGAAWIPAPLVARLALCGWPGHLRQLRNAVRQIVIAGRDGGTVAMELAAERLMAGEHRAEQGGEPHGEMAAAPPFPLDRAAPSPSSELPQRAPRRTYRRPGEVSDGELLAALRAHRWRIQPAARALGLSRPSLYDCIDRSPLLRKAADLSREEIKACRARAGGDLDAMAELLEVSKRGLQRRLTQLGIAPS
jgi:two-component system nitrogen regulation response regulator GlnG